MRTLEKKLQDFSFVSREKVEGKTVANTCGRDFLYYALNFYYPARFNAETNSPQDIDNQSLFGLPTHPLLAWTQLQFVKAPKFLSKLGLEWKINDREITGYFNLFNAILFSRKGVEEAIADVMKSIDKNEAVGIDISLGFFGLLDHVLFVYGYDAENLFVFDTHTVPKLEYEPIQPPYCYKLPKEVARKRWTRFGRVWKVRPLN